MSSDRVDAAERSAPEPLDEPQIRALVVRLARPHASGGRVVERAALLAEGADFDATVAWILRHGGEPEASTPVATRGGLYGSRSDSARATGATRRFVLPPGALD